MNTVSIFEELSRDIGHGSLIKDTVPIYTSGHRTAWKEELIKTLVEMYGCSFTIEKNMIGKTEYHLVGHESNISKIRTLWNSLTLQIGNFAKLHVGGSGKVAIQSYCLGYVEGLRVKLQAVFGPSDHLQSRSAAVFAEFTNLQNCNITPCKAFHIDQFAFQQGKLHGEQC